MLLLNRDILFLGGGYAPMAMAQSVREMAEFARKYDVSTYACISVSGMKEHSGYEGTHAVQHLHDLLPLRREVLLEELTSTHAEQQGK